MSSTQSIAVYEKTRYNTGMKRKWNSLNTKARIVLAAVVLLAAALLIFCAAHKTAPPQESSPPAETAMPSPTPTTEPEPEYAAEARRLLAGMTTREKICQLLIMQPEFIDGANGNVKTLSPALENTLAQYPIGGVLLSLQNMDSAGQLTALTAALQDVSQIPMIICVDEEGGDVSRLMLKVGTTKLDTMYAYREEGTAVARRNARTLGSDLSRFGFNTDLAPVADVWSNPQNKVIGERAYSDDFETAAKLVAAAVQGFHDSGTICCLKHFPGHGSTRTDSHKEAAFVDATLQELRAGELLPFASGIEAGADMVMVGHLTVPAIDHVPATFSHAIVTDLLRGELGFEGVVITDGLEMKAAGTQPDGTKALRALDAGCDLLLGLYDLPGTVQAIEQALDAGELTPEALDEHVLRVLMLKLQYGLIPDADSANAPPEAKS